MLNVHLGAQGIVPDLIQALAAREPVRSAENLYLLPPAEYGLLFRELVNAKERTGPPSLETLRGIEEFTQLATALETVAMSQSIFLGYPADALRQRKSFPLAEARVGSGLVLRS
jgi:hypothetical protein